MFRPPRFLSSMSLLASVLMAAGCATPDAGMRGAPSSSVSRPTGEPLVGEWRIEDVDGTGIAAGSEPLISFAPDGGVSGSAGCNRFFGRYAMEGGDLRFSGLGSTKRACAPELMRQETRILSGLGATRMLERLPDGSLALLGEGRGKLLLRRAGTAPGPAAAPPARSRAPVGTAPWNRPGPPDAAEKAITGGFGHLYCPG